MAQEFPWAAFMEAMKTKNQNQQGMMDQFGGALAATGQNAGAAIAKHKKQQQMDDFFKANSQPMPHTVSAQGSTGIPAASFDPNSGQTTPLTQPNPMAQMFPQGMGKLPPEVAQKVMETMISKQAESPYQKQELDLRNRQLQLETKKAGIDEKYKQADLLERQGYHDESLRVRKELAEDKKDYMSLMFNARQQQTADTKNMGIGGFFRNLFGGGVNPSKVPAGGSDRNTVRQQLGLQ